MPELPDLEVISDYLRREVVGAEVQQVAVLKPIVLRNLYGGAPQQGAGSPVTAVERRGKFLLLPLASGAFWVVNPMLAGYLRYHATNERVPGQPFLRLVLSNGHTLAYYDRVLMGKVYLTPRLDLVPGFAELGPEALDPGLTLPAFAGRLSHYHGEIKGILTNQQFVAGIGNAYADEILFCAGLYPFRKRKTLSPAEVSRLYDCMHSVLTAAIATLREKMGPNIHEERRDFLAVHGKGGSPCPRCGATISELRARQRITSFCRTCQPGTLIQQ
ncbi:MAG TPA: DNA-formamidopyrimidine glycosylase family protein [Anaerolineae bacterium]|nr:DNA-formamidopyrimidine glycosylase family protein [Anaerolineae bacterium]